MENTRLIRKYAMQFLVLAMLLGIHSSDAYCISPANLRPPTTSELMHDASYVFIGTSRETSSDIQPDVYFNIDCIVKTDGSRIDGVLDRPVRVKSFVGALNCGVSIRKNEQVLLFVRDLNYNARSDEWTLELSPARNGYPHSEIRPVPDATRFSPFQGHPHYLMKGESCPKPSQDIVERAPVLTFQSASKLMPPRESMIIPEPARKEEAAISSKPTWSLEMVSFKLRSNFYRRKLSELVNRITEKVSSPWY